MVVHTSNSSTQVAKAGWVSICWSPVWSTEQVPEKIQLLNRENVSQKTKTRKESKEKKIEYHTNGHMLFIL